MPLTPEPALTEGAAYGAQTAPKKPFWRAVFVLFSLGIGLFLVVFPWSDGWNLNYIQDFIPGLRGVWNEPSFRGAITGLGLINLYVACVATAQLLRRRA
ncbi:MAG TPA: hypothetical protein VH639_13945 [Bryobacteraceae bacterium]|jgi:hypothetical protein